jgi:hypothetical protein
MMPMRLSRNMVLLVGMMIPLILLAFGCDSGTKGSAPQQDQKAEGLRFADASKGLPAAGLWRQSIAFFDLNGDGHLDIVAPPPRKSEKYTKPVVWHGNGKGEWSEVQLEVPTDAIYDYGGIGVADFDGDGKPDIFLAMHGSAPSLKALRGMGEGRYVDFSKGLPTAKEFRSRALIVDDMNHDGRPDVVCLSQRPVHGPGDDKKSPVWGCSWTGDKWKCERFGNEQEMDALFGDQLAAGDVNGDGNRDLALGSLSAQNNWVVWLGDGKGGFVPFCGGLPQEKLYYAVTLADIDKDGRDDLIASISGFGDKALTGPRAFLSRPETFEEISQGLPDRTTFRALTASDLDGDGSPEIIGATGAGGLSLFSYKEGRWHEMKVSGLPTEGLKTIYNVYCLDLNGDGLKDLALNYSLETTHSGGIRVFYNVTNQGLKEKGR